MCGIESGHNQLDGSKRWQAGGVVQQGSCGQAGGGGIEAAVLEEHPDDRLSEDDQPHGRRQRDKRDDAQGEAEGLLHRVVIARSGLVRHHRQNGSGHSDGVPAQHQLHHPVGHVQRSHRSRTYPQHLLGSGEDRVHEKIHLRDTDAEKPRHHQPRHSPYAGMREGEAEVEAHPLSHQQGQLHKELQRPAHQNPYRQRHGLIGEVSIYHRDGERDNGNIQQDGRCGRWAEDMEAVQNCHGQRRQANEENVGEHDAIQFHCCSPLPLLLAEHREHVNHARRKHHAQHREHG